MSAELLSISEPHGNSEAPREIPVGGSKPLHRFLKGQPKIIGIVVLIMGLSIVVVSVAIISGHWTGQWTVIPPNIILGTLFSVSGILYILTAHNLTKKTVTISLALSIVTILVASWIFIRIVGEIQYHLGMHDYEVSYNKTNTPWMSYYEAMGVTIDVLLLFYSVVGTLIFIVMSVFAGVALRSTKTQAVVMMNMTPLE